MDTTILRALRKHKTAALLIVLETALTCAIVANALHLVGERLAVVLRPDAIPAADLLVLAAAPDKPLESGAARDLTERDLAALRALPGVAAATFAEQVPYGGSNNYGGLSKDDAPGARSFHTSMYIADPGFVDTMQLRFSAGGPFGGAYPWSGDALADFSRVPPSVIVNRELAEALYPGESALGKPLFQIKFFTITGVADNLPLSSPQQKPVGQRYAALFQVRPQTPGGFYLLRAQAGLPADARAALREQAQAALRANLSRRQIVKAEWMDALRSEYDRDDRQMAWLMAAVTAVLLLVTTGGVVGLMSFWVQQRTRMIGTRRALGATRAQVLRYFLAENALLTGAGAALGMAGAFGLSLVLKAHWEVAALPAWYLPAGAAVLLALGQVAVWLPARRAARVSPVVALRS